MAALGAILPNSLSPSYPLLPPAVSGERFEFDSIAGRICVYVAGKGPPLLLIHTINASASAAEVRPMHEHFQASRTVFSIDLPGYGFSERTDREYNPRLMTDAILALVKQIHASFGEAPIDALAVSLSCEFLARAAMEQPTYFRSISLVSPTGFQGNASRRKPIGSTLAFPRLHRILAYPRWSDSLFRWLTKPGVIRYFLGRSWGSPNIDETLWEYDLITTRQPGAKYAPLHFLAASMFSADIHTVYESINIPVWTSHGVRGDFTDYRNMKIIKHKPNWSNTIFPTGALPYFEVPVEFNDALDTFLSC
jgi:pimeloyl-ACP methyl ester carboxylesterase